MVLPFLLFAGAIHIDFSELKKQKWSVFIFAFFSTLISTLLIGYLSFTAFNLLGIDLPLLYCMLFGALISPTDPIAVLSIFKNYKVRRSLTMKIEGESLFNDGLGIVVFITISGMIGSDAASVTPSEIVLLFLREAVGGIAFGLLVGWFAILILERITVNKYAIYTTLLIATLSYSVANHLEVSGALAMVAAGIFIGNWMHTKAKPEIRTDTTKFWELIDELFNTMLFVLMGFSIIQINFDVVSVSAAIAAILIVVFSRFISVSIPYSLIGINKHKTKFQAGLKEILVLTWSGLRGGLAFALALSLINIEGGHFIIYITYAVAVFSIIVQGLSIGKLVTSLKLS
jgi:CPA1 family monovalent cation:H+ antiporter